MRAGDIPRPDQRRADQVRFSTAVRGRTTIIPSTDGDFRLPVMFVIVRLAPRNAPPFRRVRPVIFYDERIHEVLSSHLLISTP